MKWRTKAKVHLTITQKESVLFDRLKINLITPPPASSYKITMMRYISRVTLPLYLLFSALPSASAVNQNATQPNVMIIFADDVGTGDVPGYWNTGLVDMPNLADLVDNGVTLTDAHSTPFCAPSRYMLLSGNYPHRGSSPTGTWRLNYDVGSQFRPGQQSIADVFRENGYKTAMFGKWHIGGEIIGSHTCLL